MEIPLIIAIAYLLWNNYSMHCIIDQLRYNQRNYIEMLTKGNDDKI